MGTSVEDRGSPVGVHDLPALAQEAVTDTSQTGAQSDEEGVRDPTGSKKRDEMLPEKHPVGALAFVGTAVSVITDL